MYFCDEVTCGLQMVPLETQLGQIWVVYGVIWYIQSLIFVRPSYEHLHTCVNYVQWVYTFTQKQCCIIIIHRCSLLNEII